MSATDKLIKTILEYPDDHSAMLNRFKRLAEEAAKEKPQAPDFSRQREEALKLWDLQRKL